MTYLTDDLTMVAYVSMHFKNSAGKIFRPFSIVENGNIFWQNLAQNFGCPSVASCTSLQQSQSLY